LKKSGRKPSAGFFQTLFIIVKKIPTSKQNKYGSSSIEISTEFNLIASIEETNEKKTLYPYIFNLSDVCLFQAERSAIECEE